MLLCLLRAPALAVSTNFWTHTTEADFGAGEMKHVVATNLGELKLSRSVQTILENHEKVSAVHSLAEGGDGVVYAGSGPEGILLKITGEKVETLAELGSGMSVTALCVNPDGSILAGCSGASGKILKIVKDGKPQEIYTSPENQYIWAMIREDDGTLLAATGPRGELLAISPMGDVKVLYDSDQNNLTSLVSDGKSNLFAGSDPDGLVYKIDRKSGEAFVLYDAAESEISALALDQHGNLYAGTAEAAGAMGEQPAAAADAGRPEGDKQPPAIADEPPAAPQPVHPPGDNADLPQPASQPPRMLILADEQQVNITTAPTEPAEAAPTPGVPMPQPPGAAGNAIYRIDPDGFVSEIFRQPATVYSIVEDNGRMLAATGPNGKIYSIDPSAEETGAMAKLDAPEVTALLRTRDGGLIAGTANAAMIARLGSGFADEGTYTSVVLDASQVSRFGKLLLTGTLPAGTSLKVSTRSGNVQDESAAGWSKWSDPQPATQYIPVGAPPARFMQYRLIFGSDGKDSAVVSDVKIAYQPANQSPQVKALVATPKAADANLFEHNADRPVLSIAWEAWDPNSDALRYELYFRTGASSPWILLKDKLTEAIYEWNTRGVADGRYELKLVASDAAANASGEGKSGSRVSEPVIVDNTPPAIGDLKTELAPGEATLSLRVADQTSSVARLEYAVDSATDWQTALPLDKMADSPDEAYRFTVSGMTAGVHQIAIRAADARGNTAYQNVTVTIAAKAAP